MKVDEWKSSHSPMSLLIPQYTVGRRSEYILNTLEI